MADKEGFVNGADFIAFDFADDQPAAGPSGSTEAATSAINSKKRKAHGDDVEASRKDKKGKGKAVDEEVAEGAAKGKSKKQEKRDKRRQEQERKTATSNGVNASTGPRNLKEERKAAERGCPWVDLVDWDSCRDPSEMLNAEIQAFYRYMSPSRAEYEIRLFTIEFITRTVKKTWPEAEISPFGSWQTQLYLPTGDIDLVVSTDRLTPSNKGRLLAELARAMRLAYITDTVAIISKARVPIIKFVTSQGRLNVDISLNQTNGIHAGRIINQYLNILPGARQLILVVKAFLSQRSMNEVYTGGLGSYSVICLVISFLQVHPKLRRLEIDPERNLGTLLIEFFELYGRNFNYDEVGISIRRGGFYYSKRSRGWSRHPQNYLLSIEDPQDQDNDISGGSYGIRQVRATLGGAYEMLQAKLFERAENMSGIKSGRYTHEMDAGDMSVLSGIMGITKETLKHREELARLHKEGRMHRMLEIPVDQDPSEILPHYRSTPPIMPLDIAQPNGNGASSEADLGAIMVEDDDVDLTMFDSDTDSERGQDNTNRGNSESDEDDEEEDDEKDENDEADGSENDDVVEVFPNGNHTIRKDRFASVSPDEEDHDEEDVDKSRPLEDLELAESRYDLGKKRRNTRKNGRQDLGEDGETDSDDSVVAIEPASKRRKPAGGAESKAKATARRDYWASKAQMGDIQDIDDDDD